jgi:hypothetical protein
MTFPVQRRIPKLLKGVKMLKFKPSMEKANAVIHILSRKLTGTITAYQNGREQGYCISIPTLPDEEDCFYFAECRNSDQFVVYQGPSSCQSLPSDEVYKNCNFFVTAKEAADFIISQVGGNQVKDSYEGGACPDCGEDIPDDIVEGGECNNCGHVFWKLKDYRVKTLSTISGLPVMVSWDAPHGVNCYIFGEPYIKSVFTYPKAKRFAEGIAIGRKLGAKHEDT